MTVLRRAHIEVLPDTSGFDTELKTQLAKSDPGGKAGKQVGGQLNRALKRFDLDPIDIKGDPKKALAAIRTTEAKLKELSRDAATVEVKVQTTRALSQLERFKKQLGDLGDDAGEQFVSKFAKDVGELGTVLDRLNLPSIDITADPSQAFRSIAETEARLKELSANATTVEIRVDAEKARLDLERIKRQLGAEAGKGGSGFKGLSLLSPEVIGGAAVVAAPVIGAAISAAVIGGAGAGGVIGGLLLVKDDPRVATAGAEIGKTLLEGLKGDAASFVEPVLGAIAVVEARFVAMQDRIKRIFSSSSGFLNPLVNGALDGIDGILAGIESLVTQGKPVIDALGESFGIIGRDIGKAFSVIAGDSEDAGAALKVVADVVGTLIEGTGYLIRAFSELYGIITYLPSKFEEIGADLLWLTGIYRATDHTVRDAAVSVAGQVAALTKNSEAAQAAARANGLFVASQEDVKAAQDASKVAQDGLNRSLDALSPAGGRAAQVADGLRKSIQALYGAQVQSTDANEAYEASWDSLSEAIKKNGRSLSIHTAAGRANRDALEAVASATRDSYTADINAGVGIDQATKKHDKRIEALKEEARRSGLDRTETQKLVDTYGSIPKGKTTKLVVAGVDQVVSALKDLYVFQRSLADGIPIASEIAKLNESKGPAKRYGGYAQGGYYEGILPGPPSSVDNLRGHGPGGDGFGLAGGEFIVNARQTAKHRAQLEDLNAGRNGFADGGYYPVEQRDFRFTTNVGGSRVPPKSEVSSKVMLAVPAGGRTSDWIIRAARQIVPGIEVLSKDRPGARTLTGNVSYHALGRAVDFHWNRKLAEVWNQRYMARTKELITPWQDLNIQNGHRHAYSPLVYNQHNFAGGNPHDHIAMAGGGVIREPVVGIGASGRTYSFGERGAETVTPGAGGNTYNITVQVAPGAHPAETGRQLVLAIQAFEQSNGTRWRSGP